MYIDTHAHFDMCMESEGVTEDLLINGLIDNSISNAVHVSIDANGFNWSYDFARKHLDSGIMFTLGIHPSSSADEASLNILKSFVEKVMESEESFLLFGIGETGLDYYRMRQPRKMQIRSFKFQLEIAKKYCLPVIVHSREAMKDTIDILNEISPGQGIMHCFSGNSKDAKRIMDLGFYISFAGNLTYKNAHELHTSALYVPLNRLFLETDAPFLAPVPLRGKKNRPEYVSYVYKFIAELRKEKISKIEQAISDNFTKINER